MISAFAKTVIAIFLKYVGRHWCLHPIMRISSYLLTSFDNSSGNSYTKVFIPILYGVWRYICPLHIFCCNSWKIGPFTLIFLHFMKFNINQLSKILICSFRKQVFVKQFESDPSISVFYFNLSSLFFALFLSVYLYLVNLLVLCLSLCWSCTEFYLSSVRYCILRTIFLNLLNKIYICSFFTRAWGCLLSTSSDMNPGTLSHLTWIKLFPRIVYGYNIRIWMLDVVGLVNRPLFMLYWWFVVLQLLIVKLKNKF